MKKIIPIILILIVTGSIVLASLFDNQFANANSRKKINFTKTITSSQDLGEGHENHQMALVLSPNTGTLYYGFLTFTSSDPVEIMILHEISKDESKGQSTWTVDGKTVYGLSLIDTQSKSGSFEFTGAALAFHRSDKKPFTITISVDGWIRGQSPEQISQIEPSKELTYPLARTTVPAKLPMHKGIYNNSTTYYIITDTSDKNYSQQITEKQKWHVSTSPLLSQTANPNIGKIYLFTNGIQGNGVFGSQDEIISKTPQSPKYSALNKVIEVTWKKGQNPEVLYSEDEVIKAKEGGRIDFKETEIIINSPQIVWSGGQMKIRDEKSSNDESPYIGGQITEIDKNGLTVTFIAHRSWDQNGKTTYQIFTDATPSGPADLMGVISSETSKDLSSNSTSILYQFKNGIASSGPLGFQPSILDNTTDSENYSPFCRINLIEWNDPENAQILENRSDIDAFLSSGKISVTVARPMNSDPIINCPSINPFQ